MRAPIDQTPDARKMLREACELSAHSMAAISRRAGVGEKLMYDWWAGIRRPRIDNFVAVANAAGYRVVLVPEEL